MANKLPHERLRIWAGKGRTAGHYSFGPAYHMAKELTEVEHPGTAGAESVAFQMLADEIEHYYIPRPRFEDGEPVRFGDEIEADGEWKGVVHEIAFCDDGTIILLDETPETICETKRDYPVTRYAPKVLDADGVPIKVGDVVWSQSGNKGTVKGCNGIDSTAYVEWDDGRWSPNILCINLTHKEPDTLTKLRDDIKSCNGDFEEWASRLTALIERGA